MKTEIDRICGIMYTLLEHQPVIDVPYEKINDIAVALVKEGYGKTSEYTAEIERLKAEVKQAKIDVLNFLKDGYEVDISTSNDCDMVVRVDDIDELIEELQNGKDKG